MPKKKLKEERQFLELGENDFVQVKIGSHCDHRGAKGTIVAIHDCKGGRMIVSQYTIVKIELSGGRHIYLPLDCCVGYGDILLKLKKSVDCCAEYRNIIPKPKKSA